MQGQILVVNTGDNGMLGAWLLVSTSTKELLRAPFLRPPFIYIKSIEYKHTIFLMCTLYRKRIEYRVTVSTYKVQSACGASGYSVLSVVEQSVRTVRDSKLSLT